MCLFVKNGFINVQNVFIRTVIFTIPKKITLFTIEVHVTAQKIHLFIQNDYSLKLFTIHAQNSSAYEEMISFTYLHFYSYSCSSACSCLYL